MDYKFLIKEMSYDEAVNFLTDWRKMREIAIDPAKYEDPFILIAAYRKGFRDGVTTEIEKMISQEA